MNRYALRRVAALLLVLTLVLPRGVSGASAAVYSVSGVGSTQVRTASELRRAWEAIRVPERRFDQAPSAVYPYALGRLNGDFLQQNLDILNFFRLSAGLPAVGCTASDNADAQHGAVLLAAANALSHAPGMPAGMDSDFYQRGRSALSTANISVVTMTGRDAAEAERNRLRAAIPGIMRSYMDGSANRAELPHRRWILHPALQAVGVGCADAADSSMYQVLKLVTAQAAAANPDYDFIAWPASGCFPVQAISPDAPWSITLNPEQFRMPDRGSISITVTRQRDGRTWALDASSSSDASDSSFLRVDAQSYGVDNCILFAFPSGEKGSFSGDYRVSVTGLRTTDGREAVLDYRMHFVDLVNCTHDWVLDGVVEESTKYRSGTAEYTCAVCGLHKRDALPLTVCRDADCPCRRFSDAPPQGSWSHNGIDFVLENGIFNGTGKTAFSPKGKMTRAMLVTVLWRIAGQPEADRDFTFTDVDAGAYYAPAVRWAGENGVVQGYSAQRFGPHDNVTREQAVTLLQRFFAPDAAYSGSMNAFADTQRVHEYARGPMCWAIEHRVITGMANADGALCLMPGDSITREQAASVIMRCMMNLNENQPDDQSG